MFYTYIFRSISQPEQRYIGSTADLKASLAIRRFFFACKNKRSATERAKDALQSLYFMLKSADLFAKICQSEFSGRYDT